MISYPANCPRHLDDCESLAQIVSDGEEKTFVCCGLNDGKTRACVQDIFRYCWFVPIADGIPGCDEMTDCDITDLNDSISVIAQAISVYNHMEKDS